MGLLAPSYTPLVWLVGIGLMSDSLYAKTPYRPWMYLVLAALFVMFHVTSGVIAYSAAL